LQCIFLMLWPRQWGTRARFLSTERFDGRIYKRFHLMRWNRKEAITLHQAHGHPNNRTLLHNQHMRWKRCTSIWKRYILVISCNACRAATGKRDNKTSAVALSKRQAKAQYKRKLTRKRLSVNSLPNMNQSWILVLILSLTRTSWTSVLSLTQWTLLPLSPNRWHFTGICSVKWQFWLIVSVTFTVYLYNWGRYTSR